MTPSRRPTALVRAAALVALAAAVAVVFARVRGYGFLWWDDATYVSENSHVRAGLARDSITWALTTGEAANWHPLTWWSHQLDVQLFGLDAGAHHLVSVALHALTSVLLVVLLARWTGSFGRAWIVGALFALHPLRVESVAWVAERKDVLAALFFVLTAHAWTAWVERPSVGRYAFALLVYALGLMSKPMLVTLPFVLLLADAWPFRRLRWPSLESPARPAALTRGESKPLAALVGEKLPFVALAACACVVTVIAQRAGGALRPEIAPGIVERAGNAFASIATYVGKSFVPIALSPYYPWRTPWTNAAFWCGLALVPLAAWIAWRTRVRAPWLAFGLAWFAGMLVPVIGLVQVGDQALADRYTYLPSIGLAIALVWTIGEIAERLHATRAAAITAFAVIAALSWATARQVRWWRDDLTLFGRALELDPENSVAHKNTGKAHLARRELAPAIEHLRRATELEPRYTEAWWNLGIALGMSGDLAGSLDALTRARDFAPWIADIHYNLGIAQLAAKRDEDALKSFERALELSPAHVGAHGNLGRLLRQRGRIAEAAEHFRAAWSADPSNAAARLGLVSCELELGQIEKVAREHAELLRSDSELRARASAAARAALATARTRGDGESVRRLESLTRELERNGR